MGDGSRGTSVLMICTRDIPAVAESGRERTMSFIRHALIEHGEIEFLRLRSVLEEGSLRRMLSAVTCGLVGLLQGRPMPLQTLLFHDPRRTRQLALEVARCRPTTVYFDGVRSGLNAEALRRRFPDLRLVCDFDDLMSHRMQVLADARQSISMGYLKKFVPAWVQRRVLDGALAPTILAYERRALLSAERRISQVCDRVVLVSSVDAQHLLRAVPGAPVEVIPPVMPSPTLNTKPLAILRFVFIGSDGLLQNRQTIEYLVALWQSQRPATPLHIFGKQSGTYPDVPGLVFRGFVPEVAAAYEPGSVLLAPSFLRGGVKTKVLEAMAHGVVPVGTGITFEGIQADTEALVFDDAKLRELVRHPACYQAALAEAGQRAIRQASETHAAERLAAQWRHVVWPAG